jgi:hypothetical protein
MASRVAGLSCGPAEGIAGISWGPEVWMDLPPPSPPSAGSGLLTGGEGVPRSLQLQEVALTSVVDPDPHGSGTLAGSGLLTRGFRGHIRKWI